MKLGPKNTSKSTSSHKVPEEKRASFVTSLAACWPKQTVHEWAKIPKAGLERLLAAQKPSQAAKQSFTRYRAGDV